jgi:hypothetical protein
MCSIFPSHGRNTTTFFPLPKTRTSQATSKNSRVSRTSCSWKSTTFSKSILLCSHVRHGLTLNRNFGTILFSWITPQQGQSSKRKWSQRLDSKKKEGTMSGANKITRITYNGDVGKYISTFKLDDRRLQSIGWTPQPIIEESHLRAAAIFLSSQKVLNLHSRHTDMPDRGMFILDFDIVTEHGRWQTLFQSSDRTHRTCPAPKERAVVFTSLVLLSNLVHCQKNCLENFGSM